MGIRGWGGEKGAVESAERRSEETYYAASDTRGFGCLSFLIGKWGIIIIVPSLAC